MSENKTLTTNLDSIKDALTCGICQDIVTLPVHPVCCERAKSMAPGCLNCVRRYYELNKNPKYRSGIKKSWVGCGCNINLVYLNNISSNYYKHTIELDIVRNVLGPSICHNEECGASCETAAELRRHLNGTAKSTDKNGNCAYAITKCKYCNVHGMRHFIEGKHYDDVHRTFRCTWCGTDINIKNIDYHYNTHVADVERFKKNLNILKSNIDRFKQINV